VTPIAVIGDECGLVSRRITESVAELHTRPLVGVTSAIHDDATETWLLRTGSGDEYHAGVVVDTRMLHRPSEPDYPCGDHFRGPAFHWAEWDDAFDPAGKRIGVIGERAAHVVEHLQGAEVTIFDCPPNWRTRKSKRRWVPHVKDPRGPQLIGPRVDRITPTGLVTVDGAEYPADAIVYATGSTIKSEIDDDALVGVRGYAVKDAWRDGAESYLGIALHGFPNYFMLMGPDTPVDMREPAAQLRSILECLHRMQRKGSGRVEVRRSAQRQFVARAHVTSPARAFEFSAAGADVYDGPATLTIDGCDHRVRARLTGHLDPIDGKYHWQGTVSEAASELASQPVKLVVDAERAEARITERTPWGSYSIAGVGAPPFGLD